MRHLDIGCGLNPRNPYNHKDLYGIDIRNSNSKNFTYKQANLATEKIPFESAFFDSVSAYDFLEHVPRILSVDSTKTTFPFINLMNEIYRVLSSGGKFYAITPYYPKDEAFSDPTHVNFIGKSTHKYFCEPYLYGEMYGFTGSFQIINVKKVRLQNESLIQGSIRKKFFDIAATLTNKKNHLLWELKVEK